MHDMIEELYQLCETLENDLAKTNDKLRKAGGELSGSDLEYVDKLTHALKSIKTVVAMAEYDDEDGYSQRGNSYARGGRGGGNRGGISNRGGNSYEGGMSYARGQRRDSRGRYSREGGYSYAEDFRGMLEDAMENAPNEQMREKLRRMMNEM